MKNFICISNYNNDVSWIKDYDNPYIIYDKSDDDSFVKDLKHIKTPNIGYNIYDIMTFIIDNYNNLPDFTTFCKGNIFPRHVGRETFENCMNNQYFTPIFDYRLHQTQMPIAMFSSDGNYSEINNSWYMGTSHPRKYITTNYNDYLNYIFENPIHPNYITFAPGANYVVPKNYILKYPVEFYMNLRKLVSHEQLPIEAHIIERSLYSIWLGSFKINKNMLNFNE
jgi:hypothetical protein